MRRNYWKIGEPWVWATGAALSVTLLIAVTLIAVIMVNGLGVFWPGKLQQLELKDGSKLLGELIQSEPVHRGEGLRRQYKIANRDLYGLDFRWIDETEILRADHPAAAIVLEREENGDFFGFLDAVQASGLELPAGAAPYAQLHAALDQVSVMKAAGHATDQQLSTASYRLEQLRRDQLKAEYQGVDPRSSSYQELLHEQERLKVDFEHLMKQQRKEQTNLRQYQATFSDANGRTSNIVLADIVQAYRPNQLAWHQQVIFYAAKLKELIVGEPRESNTEGGLFPAIFGTIMLIFTMSLFSFPLGVIAAIYLREYAREGVVVRVVRIAVNNLAGIPSIVYGIFGLGFFVYGIGSNIDKLFFPELLPTPTFGTGGILWASLTLALLTVPVVIVATEEALGAIPREFREGSLALGATRFQTLLRILLPMASPGIMTGLILAMARAAGEVAPLMITGVVKLAPALPIDGNFPFFHLDRKFMHLGFHIFDIGFQSPNVEAAKPMVFVTTLLLVLIVLAMSSLAIRLRNRMKKRYTFSTF
ncbi:MAG: phosphate ABC transporter permease PstA [Desulfuromonadales bacterium]|nr:phosphate ABC transporter permease PstA [Desulfuromonadales bacterium]